MQWLTFPVKERKIAQFNFCFSKCKPQTPTHLSMEKLTVRDYSSFSKHEGRWQLLKKALVYLILHVSKVCHPRRLDGTGTATAPSKRVLSSFFLPSLVSELSGELAASLADYINTQPAAFNGAVTRPPSPTKNWRAGRDNELLTERPHFCGGGDHVK